MKINRFIFTVAGAVLLAGNSRAHSPFESGVRAIVHDHSVEIILTVGQDGGRALLADAPATVLQPRAVGAGDPLPAKLVAKLFSVSGGAAACAPEKSTARTDGLEFAIAAEYPWPAGGTLALDALYVDALPPGFKSAFVLTDENGNVLASRILRQGDHTFAVNLPAPAVATSSAPAAPTVAAPPPAPVLAFRDFLRLGVEHILTGYDHLLFLCGLLVACRRVRPMLAIVTCFTAAHSVTLALAAMNLVQIPARIVEPLIAVSIVCVGLENLRGREDVKARCALALGFGLIHGFGFADALRTTGLGRSGRALLEPLFSFNFGVECGQLAVAAVFLPALFLLRRQPAFARFGTPALSTAVVALGGFWLVQRVFDF